MTVAPGFEHGRSAPLARCSGDPPCRHWTAPDADRAIHAVVARLRSDAGRKVSLARPQLCGGASWASIDRGKLRQRDPRADRGFHDRVRPPAGLHRRSPARPPAAARCRKPAGRNRQLRRRAHGCASAAASEKVFFGDRKAALLDLLSQQFPTARRPPRRAHQSGHLPVLTTSIPTPASKRGSAGFSTP